VPPTGVVAANADLMRRVPAEVAHGQLAVVDLVGCDDRIDAHGLSALLALVAGVLRSGGRVAIAARGKLARQLRFIGIERVATVCDSTAEACNVLTTR